MAEVTDNPAERRFTLQHGRDMAFVAYRHAGDRIEMIHTEVPPALAGQGIGSALVRGALDQVRAAGLRVVPRCSFVAGFIGRHPEYRSLVAAD